MDEAAAAPDPAGALIAQRERVLNGAASEDLHWTSGHARTAQYSRLCSPLQECEVQDGAPDTAGKNTAVGTLLHCSARAWLGV